MNARKFGWFTLICLSVLVMSCKHKGNIRAQIQRQVPAGFIEGDWAYLSASGSQEGDFQYDGQVVQCTVTITVNGTVNGQPFTGTYSATVTQTGAKGGHYKLDCSDPLLLQFPSDGKDFSGTYLNVDNGSTGALLVSAGMSCVPIGPSDTLCAESDQQLVLMSLPPGLPLGDYLFRLDFSLGYSRPIDIKSIYTALTTCGNQIYYPPIVPCVTSFGAVAAVTIPALDVPVPILPPLDGVAACPFVSIVCPPPGCRGDMNCDGKIDFTDIDPFVAVLSGGPCCDPTNYNCDVNGDGLIDFADIDPFVTLLSNGATCP